MVLATKFGGRLVGGSTEPRATREYIRGALDASLARLHTDYVDLYQHHVDDLETPLEETIGALDEFVREGRIRAYGTSNHSPERIERVAALARETYVSE